MSTDRCHLIREAVLASFTSSTLGERPNSPVLEGRRLVHLMGEFNNIVELLQCPLAPFQHHKHGSQ